MIVVGARARYAVRLLMVLVCASCLSWGPAVGFHATSHLSVGPVQPGHHHHAPSGEHGAQAGEDGAVTRRRRRSRGVTRGVRARTPWRTLDLVHRAGEVLAPLVPDVRSLRSASSVSLTRLSGCRT